MSCRTIFLASLLASLGPLAQGKLYSDPSELPQTSYDFVIVGGGTAGNVVANRLTEVPQFSVLVIEAGLSNYAVPDDQVPFLDAGLAPDTIISWNYTTTPQIGLNNRTLSYPRGHVLGGSSTINYMVWTRGSVDDYDRYAKVTGDPGWSWNGMFPYMLKSEKLVPSPGGQNTVGQVNPSVHGTSGPVQVSLEGFAADIDQRVFKTTYDLPHEFPFNIDYNSGYPLGLGYAQVSVTSDGRRSDSATAYLDPILQRPNLDVLINTQATKLIASDTIEGKLAFTKVEMAQDSAGPRYIVCAAKEVVLSAGSIGTPQILQLSGIGDSALLRSVNVTPLVDLPDVGQHLADHPLTGVQWLVNSTQTFEAVTRNTTLQAELLALWNTTGTGLYVDPGTQQIAFRRLDNESEIFSIYGDPTAGAASPVLELVPNNGFVSFVETTPDAGNYMSMTTIVLSPISRGSVAIASNNPFDDPLINPNLLSEPLDVIGMIQAIKFARQFSQAASWEGYIIEETADFAALQTDAEIAEYVRSSVTSVFHPVGTARMSKDDSAEGVLTPSLLVKGTSGLRIVDASVLPYLPAAHPQACVYAVAERAADLIKSAWGVL